MEKLNNQNRGSKPTGLAKPGKTCGLMCIGPGLACQEAAGQVFGGSGTEPNHFSGPNPDRCLLTWTQC